MKKSILFLLLLCVAGMTNAFAYNFSSVCATGQTLYYNITDYTHHYVAITYPGTSGSYWNGYTKPSGNITLPVSVYYNGFTYTVKAIGNHAFHDCSDLTGNLSIPNTVTTIGDYAFYLCDFTGSLTIGNSVTSIGNYAFCGGCDFTGALTIPNSVTTIGDYAFYDCCRFTGTLTLGNSLTTIGERAFGSCSLASYNNTTGFTGSLTIPNSVTTIGNRAFEGCFSFSGSLTIGNSVTSIGHEAFINCTGFTGSLTISNSVTSIGYGAFDNCTGFTQVYFNATNCADVSTTDEPFRICGGTLNIGSNVQRIPAHIFHGSSFTHLNYNATNCANPSPSAVPFADLGGTLTIGSTVQRIPTYMFCNCTGFTGSLTIPNSVTTIDSYAFKDCTGFTGSLNIGNSVTTIGGYAFYGCTGFTGSLTIPNSVTTIGNSAFKNCSSFTQVKFNAVNCADVTSGAKPFEGCGGTLTIGSTVQRIPAYMFYDCTGFTGSLTIPSSVLTIGNYAFYGNNFTGPLTILGNSMTSIGNYAFYECCLLTGTLTIPNSVTTIGDYAFYDCCRFTGTLTLGNSLTTIGEKAFYSCSLGGYNTTGFTGSLTIPNSVTSIGNNAFEGCFTFSGSLTIGNSVATIGTEAFKGCTGFTLMKVYPETPPTLGTNAFENVPTNIPVYVPCGSLADYQAANGWNAFTNMQRINNNCDLLTYSINDDGVSVTVTGHVDGTAATGQLFIPETTTIDGVTYAVTAIGDYAFNNYRRFTGSLTIPNSVTTIGQRAFQNCVGFSGSLTIPNSVATIGQEAFRSCVGFTGSLTIGNSVTTIGNSAFWGCTGFRGSLTLGSSLTTISSQAFYYCNGFTGSLTIPNSVTTIGSDAFNGCSGFTGTLTIGYSVTNINTRAFKDCNNFTAMMVFPETPPTLGSTVFQNVPTTIPVAVPCGSLADYQTANGWSTFTNMQCIPDILTVYEDGAATCNYVPVYGLYADEYQKCQFIIPAEQLQDMAQSYISGMSFYLSSPASEAWTATFYVEMIEVDNSYFSSNHFISDVYQLGYIVYHGTLDATGSTMDINFSNPYLYGSGNLLVSFRITTPGNYKSATFIGETVANTASLYAHSSTTTSNNITTGTQCNFLPKTTFTFTPTSSCPRPTHVEANNITAEGATLTWGTLGQYVVEWKKISDATWNHITLTGNTYTLSSLEPNTNYNVRVRKACSSTSFSNWYTISFTTDCSVYSLPYTYGFEEEYKFNCWTMLDCHQNTGRSNSTYSIHQGNYGFRFYYSTNPPQYLISPELDCPAGVNVSFYYKNYLDNYPETFQVGYSTTTKSPDAFIWSAEVTAQDESNWMLYEDTFPVGTKYVAVMLNSNNQYYLYLDDFSLTPVNQWEFPITGGDWHLIASPVAGINPANITNMTSGEYDLYSFSPTATSEEWQNYKSATFTLQSGQGYLYSHGTGITLNFNGEAYNGNGEFTLTYDATDERKCWNLVGNPFPCAATINRDYYILNEEDQTINPTPITDNTPIPACTAVFVKATGAGDTVVFTVTAP